jgi:hypothetical protein
MIQILFTQSWGDSVILSGYYKSCMRTSTIRAGWFLIYQRRNLLGSLTPSSLRGDAKSLSHSWKKLLNMKSLSMIRSFLHFWQYLTLTHIDKTLVLLIRLWLYMISYQVAEISVLILSKTDFKTSRSNSSTRSILWTNLKNSELIRTWTPSKEISKAISRSWATLSKIFVNKGS